MNAVDLAAPEAMICTEGFCNEKDSKQIQSLLRIHKHITTRIYIYIYNLVQNLQCLGYKEMALIP